MWEALRAAITQKIQDESTKIQVVYPAMQSKFSGTPAAVVVPGDLDGKDETNMQDKLSFPFSIRVYVPNDIEGQNEADAILDKCMDELITIFSKYNALGDACDYSDPVNGSWGYTTLPSGEMRVAELKIKCIEHIANR